MIRTQKIVLAALAGFVTLFITNGLMAAVVIGPLFEDRYRDSVADPTNFPLLVIGYLIQAIAITIIYAGIQPAQNWFTQSLKIGISLGLAMFLGTHTIISGYTTIETVGFILSGLFDSLGPVIGTITIAYIYQRNRQPS